ncbi:MAG: zf-HC2 domain-containing protein [Elusimicrobia bacterium]|nr:zf-HC2 domain-containing protein [Elusimicrobiota bacterium]
MNCNEAGNLLSAYLDGDLGRSETKDLQAHLGECLGCAKELEGLGQAKSLLQGEPSFAMPPNLRRSLIQEARQRLAFRPSGILPRFISRPALAVARTRKLAIAFSFAGVVLVFGLWLYKDRSGQEAVPLDLFLAEHTRSVSRVTLARRTVAAASPYYSLQAVINP